MFDSKKYWERRYKKGGSSGAGSCGILGRYKAFVINEFVKNNDIRTVCDLGCGDKQFVLYDVPDFTGYDVSSFIIEKNKKKYRHKFTASMDDLTHYDLTISMDVILHLIEGDVYQEYMKNLFRLSDKYVIIYSPNKNEILKRKHNRYREFLPDVPPDFELIEFIDNPHKGVSTQADFYIFKKRYG